MTSDPITVYQAIGNAYKTIAATDFAKSGTVGTGRNSYKFVPIGQILGAVRKANSEQGIVVVFGRPEYDPQQCEKRYSYERQTEYGKTTWHAANGHIDVRIFGPAGDCIEMTVPCEAQDNSDKLTNKLITNAERTLYRTLYAIDEDDAEDPETICDENTTELTPKPDRKEHSEKAKKDPFFGSSKGDFVTADKLGDSR